MGRLDHPSGDHLALGARALVGRSARCDLKLSDRTVSGEHASLQWRDGVWQLRDLGSRNGTFVGGDRLPLGGVRALARGDTLTFGSVHGWVLTDATGPVAVAVGADGRRVPAVADLIALPSADDPERVLYADAQGRWWVEADEARVPLDGPVEAGGTRWTLERPTAVDGTATVAGRRRLDAVRLGFTVSRDEERVGLTVLHRGRAEPLEAREHLYILLTLARLRLADAALPLTEQGWVDRPTLQRMLGLGSNALNVAIHRARRQLSAAGIEGAAGIVEVRRGHRRFGVEPERVTVQTA